MDDRLRQLERAYQQDPTSDKLFLFLQECARAGVQSQGDIAALRLIREDPHWYQGFSSEAIKTLIGLGYPIGVYLDITIQYYHPRKHPKKLSLRPSFLYPVSETARLAQPRRSIPFPTLGKIIDTLHRRLRQRIKDVASMLQVLHPTWGEPIDVLDGWPLTDRSPHVVAGAQLARNRAEVANQLLADTENTLQVMQQYSSMITPPYMIKHFDGGSTSTETGETRAIYRIFLPVQEIERAYWHYLRSRRRARYHSAQSMIDWKSARVFKKLRKELCSNIREWIDRLDEKHQALRVQTSSFGKNLLLGLDTYHPFRTHSWLASS